MQTANLIEAIEHSAELQGLIASDLMQDIHRRQGSQIIGSSRIMEHLRREIEIVAASDFTVMVLGETGVGKELVVRAIHAASARSDGPMLYLNCAALPETLAETELFGHIKGAFTGASRDRAGKFELSDKGTLFLDEIGELPPSIQAKLLRAIQEGEIQRVGSEKTIYVDVRLLVATNRHLEEEVKAGRFRADLYHRLNVYPIKVPALREHKEDIPLLTGYFCERTQRRLGLGPVRISTNAVDILSRYSWPGNVRELQNVIRRMIVQGESEEIIKEIIRKTDESRHTPQSFSAENKNLSHLIDSLGLNEESLDLSSLSLKKIRKKTANYVEKEVISYVLKHTGWNRKKTAKILNVSYRTIFMKMHDLDITTPAYLL